MALHFTEPVQPHQCAESQCRALAMLAHSSYCLALTGAVVAVLVVAWVVQVMGARAVEVGRAAGRGGRRQGS
jgi:hypothetical protein